MHNMEAKNKQLSPSSYKKPALIAAFSVLLITFIIYLPALQNGFVNWDDNIYVYENKNIQSIDYGLLRWSFTARVMDLWHPLSFLSFAFDYAVWGLNPTGYHLNNIFLHALNAVLVYLLSIRLIRYGNNVFYKRAIIAGFIASLLFGIHPLRVESVVWVAERKDVLCTFFFLLSLYAYLRYVSASIKRFNYAACLIFYVLALLSKPMAISLPIVLLILDYYPLKRLTNKENIRTALMEKMPFFFTGALVVMVTLWPNLSGSAADTGGHPIAERMAIFLHGAMVYLYKMALPINLAPLYPYPLNIRYLDYEYIISVALILLFSYYSIRSIKKRKVFFCIWLYYITTLLPVIGVIGGGPHSMADRYTYLPSIGPFLLVGLGIAAFFERCSKNHYQPAVIGVSIFLIVLLGFKTIRQIAVWKDSTSLWSYEIKIFPGVALSYYNRGLGYDSLGAYQEAIRDFSKAIEINHNHSAAYNNRGVDYGVIGNYQLALKDFEKVIELDPKNVTVYNNRGNVYYSMGNYSQAVEDYKKAVEFDPKNAKAYYNLGSAYSIMENSEQALLNYKKAAALGLKEAQGFHLSQ